MHPNQYPYLGRSYLVYKKAVPLKDYVLVAFPHFDEAQRLIGKWQRACEATFESKLWPNIAMLANDWTQTHIHLIPRWKGALIYFDGVAFEDPQKDKLNDLGYPQYNYAPYPHTKLQDDTLMKIKERIKTEICKL